MRFLKNLAMGLSVIGLAASPKYDTTVLPFILRNISVLGIDSVNAPFAARKKIWERLATDLKPSHLDEAVTTIGLDDLPSIFSEVMAGSITGRRVVKLGS